MAEPLSIDVYWSFRSPWSYLATPRLRAWLDEYALRVHLRPVYPLALRTPEFFEHVHPLWFSYFVRDVTRVAQFLGVPFGPPRPDPVESVPGSGGRPRFAQEQPRVTRLTRLGVLAEEQGAGIAFAGEVAALIWGGVERWDEGDHLARAAQSVGLDLAKLDAEIDADPIRIERVIEQNQIAHEAAGHWGVPTCVFRGEPFFGQDRLDVLLWRLQQAGLERR